MNPEISAFVSQRFPSFARFLTEFDRSIAPDADPDDDEPVNRLAQWIEATSATCAAIGHLLQDEDPRQLRDLQARFRDAIWPWFGKSWFMQRALSKPRGYPGDFEMLSAIYERTPKSLGIGGCLDRYFLNSVLARAVRARMQSVRQFLEREIARRSGKIAIVNVACGPCREYQERLEVTPEQEIEITCVDNDQMALDFARRQILPVMTDRVDFRFARHNALRMISASANVRRFGRSDIIYSVGLCDYIPDEFLVPMLRGWRESLKDGGIVYVAFKDSRRYDATEYQWFVDWYFFQRTEEDCRRLFADAGYDMNQLTTTRDSTGVILNFIGRKTAGDALRTDQAERIRMPQRSDSVVRPTSEFMPQPN